MNYISLHRLRLKPWNPHSHVKVKKYILKNKQMNNSDWKVDIENQIQKLLDPHVSMEGSQNSQKTGK